MSAVARDQVSSVTAQVTQRWQAIDPLLPLPAVAPPGCGAELVVAGPGGAPAAAGTCEHWEGAAGSLDLAYGAARRFQLAAQVAGPDVAGSLDRLLSLWRDHVADLPGADDQDSAAMVTWPSRDVEGAGALLRHGLVPLSVIAARRAGHPAGSAAGTGVTARAAGRTEQSVQIRRAGPADIDTVVRLGMEVIRFNTHFGVLVERPGTAEALRREAAGLLAAPAAWIWLAGRDGMPIGMLYAKPPKSAEWIAPMARPAPVAYLELMGVVPGERGRRVGAALAARLNQETEAAGVAVTLLHYEPLNPLAAPFWSQQGYRPLWTSWEARPARAIR